VKLKFLRGKNKLLIIIVWLYDRRKMLLKKKRPKTMLCITAPVLGILHFMR